MALFVSFKPRYTISLLQFNIWQEGTVVSGGFDTVADEIAKADADFVTLSEVRNYKDTRFCDRIVEKLREKGKTYYSFYSNDSGILSKYPIKESSTVYPLKNDQGSIYKAVVDVNGREFAVYTAHLDYRHCASYLPRGYSGTDWHRLPEAVKDVDAVLKDNRDSQRSIAIAKFLEEAAKDKAMGRIVLLGGDFNEPSHLDWTESTARLFDHNGLVIPWDVTVALEKAGFMDVYREKYPNPVTHPGFTFPTDCPGVPLQKLAWSPSADDRERIDYVFYLPEQKLSLSKIHMIGPSGMVCRNQRIPADTKDPVEKPSNLQKWPTDHRALYAEFAY